ncbi:hypothetical protein E2C01_008544 [Portunus trituberculatus]|uniref:Uncharacterized protein n=1 Tax=Portunus trituberculatus TaxID=210409 RepID=A0A5B7D487_PORTR|nr:hypothetical protein [Portunus trituberculatus]
MAEVRWAGLSVSSVSQFGSNSSVLFAHLQAVQVGEDARVTQRLEPLHRCLGCLDVPGIELLAATHKDAHLLTILLRTEKGHNTLHLTRSFPTLN